MQDDDIPFEKVRNAIARDPALTAKLIRLANSARFGLARQVATLDDALTLVGLNQTKAYLWLVLWQKYPSPYSMLRQHHPISLILSNYQKASSEQD